MKILTFDIEEWFHILDFEETNDFSKWNSFESRIESNMEKIFNLLENRKVKATFFILGWIAEKYPKLIKRINDLGYEIGSHTHYHQLLYNKSRKFIENDLEKSIKIIEDLTGNKVESFRAPGFSICESNKWVFEVLLKYGISKDSSIFPARRSHGGMSSYSCSSPSIINYNGSFVKEFPINTIDFCSLKWVYSGGGYFRLSPYILTKYFTRKSDYIMTYFHPRDFDYNQPVLRNLSILRKFKSYYGLKTSYKKLNLWINDFNFIDLRSADEQIDWNKVPKIKI